MDVKFLGPVGERDLAVRVTTGRWFWKKARLYVGNWWVWESPGTGEIAPKGTVEAIYRALDEAKLA